MTARKTKTKAGVTANAGAKTKAKGKSAEKDRGAAAGPDAGRQYSRLPESIRAQVKKEEVGGITFMRKFFAIHVDKVDGTRVTFVEYADGTWRQEKP